MLDHDNLYKIILVVFVMRLVSIFFVGLMLLSFAAAVEINEDFDGNVIVREYGNSIRLGLDISNASDGVYNVYTLADIDLEPKDTFVIDGGSASREFTIAPNDNLDVEGFYIFTYTLNHRGVEKFDNKFNVKLVSLRDVLDISSDSVSLEDNYTTIRIENLENVALENVSARFSSVLFDAEETFDIEPLATTEILVELDSDSLRRTKAGVYVIEAFFDTPDGEVKVDGNLYLGEKKGITTTRDVGGLLIRTESVAKINAGNTVESVEVKMDRNIISRLFTSFNIEPTSVDRSGLVVEYSWVKGRLGPTEAFVVKARTSYVLPILIIILLVIVFFGIKRFAETKVEVRKSVSHVRTKGGEYALRIKLAIKAKKDVENVSLIDKVPAIVKIYKKFGTVKPDKIDAASRRIYWNIGDLNAGETRVFSYIVYSKVGVVGKFSMPAALSVFEKEGKIHEVESNRVYFMSDQIRGD